MIFSKPQEVENKLNEVKNQQKIDISAIGELNVAIQFFIAFDKDNKKIQNIQWQRRKGIDLIINFSDDSKIKVEVKTSRLKKDYLRNFLIYGIPIKKKDFENKFDLLAMVNLKNDYETDHFLYFPFEIFNKLKPNPLNIIPKTTFMSLFDKYQYDKNNPKSGYIGKILPRQVNNDSYKSIIIPGEYQTNSTNFPEWFGKKEECAFIREYHLSIKQFYEQEILNNIELRKDLLAFCKNSIQLKKEKNFEEIYISEVYYENYCLNCSEKCLYTVNKRTV